MLVIIGVALFEDVCPASWKSTTCRWDGNQQRKL